MISPNFIPSPSVDFSRDKPFSSPNRSKYSSATSPTPVHSLTNKVRGGAQKLPHLSRELIMDSPSSSSRKSSPSAKKMKNVPIELTSYGTTPSGKPRLFVCQVCTRAFARLEHLRRHERSHTKEKPFSCGVCQRKFSRRDLLLRHAQKLHAGCADAITRLRRKSIKRSNSLSSQNSSTLINESSPIDDDDDDSKDIKLDKKFKLLATSAPSLASKKLDSVQFNLNLFNHTKLSRSNSLTNGSTPSQTPVPTPGSLQRQVFDRKKIGRNRGASFSAQSGANYAIGLPEFNDSYPGADNVEFSTPQLLPTSMSDETSWLNNLSNIPGMNETSSGSPYNLMQDAIQRQNNPSSSSKQQHGSFSSISLDNGLSQLPDHPSHHGSFSAQNQMLRSDSLLSSSSYSNFDSMGSYPYMVPTATVTSENSSKQAPELPKPANDDDYGYSFYDIPESMLLSKFDQFKIPHSLTPIRQEEDDELMDDIPENAHPAPSQLANSITTNGVNFDLNFLYDIDELTHEYDVNTKFVGGGYSFYGDNPSVSSSGIESSNSPPHITSPTKSAQDQLISHFEASNNPNNTKFLNQSQLMNISSSNSSTIPSNNNQHLLGKYTKNKLFTSNMRYMINKSLSKYPISGIMTPTIPSNEKLEFYLNNFISIFLYHFPFIHISKLNEYEIMNMTINEDNSNESARVCLPLLIATIGALLANNKNDSEHLYEASRRIIHIYLESRKNSVGDQNGLGGLAGSGNSVNPLWLIQSLTLSVIYGLFSDNENNVYIVIRQLNALNSLVKTSIKSNRTILFSINGEDEKIFNQLNHNSNRSNLFNENSNNTHESEMLNSNSLFNNNFFNLNDKIKFKNNIMIQSQTRIVFMIYRLTNFLLMTYNVPLTLSINDLGNLKSPNKNDEFLWNFKNYQAFQEFNQSLNNNKNIDYYLSTSNQIVFKDVLLQLTKNHVDNGASPLNQENLDAKLSSLSKYGFISIVHGVFEIKQYDDLKRINVFNILDHLTKFITDDSNDELSKLNQYNSNHNHHQPPHDDFEKLDYALLINFIKISSLIDFKLFKEQSWLKNYDELTKNYSIFLNSMENVNDSDYLKIIDSCIIIIKLVLFKTDNHNDNLNGNSKSKSKSTSTNSDELFQTQLNYYQNHHPTVNDLVNESLSSHSNDFEKSINIQVFDEIDNSKNSIHSQMLFHIFTILSMFAISIIKKNHQVNNGFGNGIKADPNLQKLNQRFIHILKLFNKVENFLKIKYQNSKLDNDLTNLCLFSNLSVSDDDLFKNNNQNPNNCFNYSLEKSLYILKLGELVLSYLYDTNVKVSIFKKLSESLSQIRKFLIDNETRILS